MRICSVPLAIGKRAVQAQPLAKGSDLQRGLEPDDTSGVFGCFRTSKLWKGEFWCMKKTGGKGEHTPRVSFLESKQPIPQFPHLCIRPLHS